MHKSRSVVALVLSIALTSLATKTFAADNIPTYARQVIDAVRTTAGNCGVTFRVAPPNTTTPADYLAFSFDGRIIAHVIDRPGIFSVKNPMGGYNHWIEYNINGIGIYTPQGKVASANRYTLGQVWQYNYYCRSQPVYPQQFDACIGQGFVEVVSQRLCRS